MPRSPAFAHAEGNSDSHIKAILVGCAHPIAVESGAPALGRWQRVFLCEFDGPRTREVWVTPLPGVNPPCDSSTRTPTSVPRSCAT